MAIFHCETKPVQRSSGRSAVAASAYRTASSLKDERTGKTHNYSNKQGVVKTDCFLFQNGEKVKLDRAELWNTSERVEKRSDSRTARDYIINLPYELTEQQRAELAEQIAEHIAQKFNVAVDYAIHLPDVDKGGDDRNHHVHILTTTRHAKLDENNVIVLGDKADIEKKNSDLKKQGKPVTQQIIKDIRKDVAELINQSLEQAKIAQRVDSRSYKEQGKAQLPTIHLGVEHTNIARKGGTTHKTMINELVHQANAENWKGTLDEYIDKTIYDLEQQIIVKSRKQPQPTQATPEHKPVIGKPQLTPTDLKPLEPKPQPKLEPVRPQTAQDYLDQLNAQLGKTVAPVEQPQTPPPPKPQPEHDPQSLINQYDKKRHSLAERFFKTELKALATKLNGLVQKYKDLQASKPRFFGKDKWQDDVTATKTEHTATKATYDTVKNGGITITHFQKATDYLTKHEQDFCNQVDQARQSLIDRARANELERQQAKATQTHPEPSVERLVRSDRVIEQPEPEPPPTVAERLEMVSIDPRLNYETRKGLEQLKAHIEAMPDLERQNKAISEFNKVVVEQLEQQQSKSRSPER